MESEAVTEDQEILVVPQVLLLVGAALEPQELEANGSSGNGATCTGGVQGHWWQFVNLLSLSVVLLEL